MKSFERFGLSIFVHPTLAAALTMATIGAVGCGGDQAKVNPTAGAAGSNAGVAVSCGSGGGGGSGMAGAGGTTVAPSCAGGGFPCSDGSCCASIAVPSGAFPMGRRTEDCGPTGCGLENSLGEMITDEGCPNGLMCAALEEPEHPMTVDRYALDKYEVTVGRFRHFVHAYACGWRPAPGTGANPNVTVGDTSWQAGWDDSASGGENLPPAGATASETQNNFATRLACTGGATQYTWTDFMGANDLKPINCVNWYEAFAFCIWDGGRLPTEAEWEYAAAGGDENRVYPWGNAAADCTRVNYNDGTGVRCGPAGSLGISSVGGYPMGNGRWGHADLAGNLFEQTLDWFIQYSATPGSNFANTGTGNSRVIRGGDFGSSASDVRATYRYENSAYYDGPSHRASHIGLRCARILTGGVSDDTGGIGGAGG